MAVSMTVMANARYPRRGLGSVRVVFCCGRFGASVRLKASMTTESENTVALTQYRRT